MSDTSRTRLVAVATADGLRRHRQLLVDGVASGILPIAALLGPDGEDPRVGQVKVVVLAQAVPGVGKVRSRRILAALGVAEGTRWGELAPGVASAVVAGLEEAATAGGASPADGR